ncbi:MlaD family protein [Commensalibacter oyaizuii]|uniref:MlaD family protein n=1 Tax=Commensalibacter oyaizuii TaxID=3043873 RepID=A0ABT6PYP3_9PROT|nr:MlaD family protein [Commensalibacter sp. TBRC 16381]MDI2089934.1 MlaD family protein [Commensalibacter sp. TBRC 16381]
MFDNKRYAKTRQLFQLRYANEWTGGLVLLCLLAFVGAVIEAGILRDWMTPAAELNIVLPQTGVDNLSVGDNVEVFGISAGTIKKINVNSDGGLSAVAAIDPQLKTFIRRDSQVTIKRQFAVAGAAYVSITRGYSSPLNWRYAVLVAKTEPNPADQISQMVLQIHERIVPTMDSAKNMMASLEMAVESIQQGKGTIGRLINNDELIRRAENMVQTLNNIIEQLKPIEQNINKVIKHSDTMVVNFGKVSKDLTKASPNLAPIAKNVNETTQQLPAMMTQLQSTVRDLQQLIVQLKGMWILGGSGKAPAKSKRLPAREVRP